MEQPKLFGGPSYLVEGRRMKLTDLFLGELEREGKSTRRVLERVPEGKNAWKPHERSMNLGYLAALVAQMPGWIEMMIHTDELDLGAPDSERFRPAEQASTKDLLAMFDANVAKAVTALSGTTEEHLMKPWSFKMGGNVASQNPRYIMIQESTINHWAHHRGQLTVFLRLNEAKVPAIYGPSGDERF
jgi:uncharacterized damage-inducible protein DinB